MVYLQMLLCVARLHGMELQRRRIAQVLLQLVLCLVVALSEDIEGASSIDVPLEPCVLPQMDLQLLDAP